MAIIGNQDATETTTLGTDKAYLHDKPSFTVTFAVDQVITEVQLYQNANTSNVANVALYDVSGGASGATIVAGTTVTFNGNPAGGATWLVQSPANLPVPAGTYALCFQSNGWPAGHNDIWLENQNVGQSGVVALPSPFVINSSSLSGGAIALYMTTQDAVANLDPTITEVNSGNTITDGSSVTVTGINFSATDNNIVYISPNPTIAEGGAVSQTVTSHSTTSLDITVDLPAGSSDQDPIYFIVVADSVESASFIAAVTPVASYLHTLTLDLECSSSDFALGMTAKLNGETASLITAVSTLPTSSPQFQVTFTQQPAGADAIYIAYDATVGDIVSTADGIPLATFSDLLGTTCP